LTNNKLNTLTAITDKMGGRDPHPIHRVINGYVDNLATQLCDRSRYCIAKTPKSLGAAQCRCNFVAFEINDLGDACVKLRWRHAGVGNSDGAEINGLGVRLVPTLDTLNTVEGPFTVRTPK
jgi:hypothetical protein